jgi:hypothetical protein
MARPDRQLLTDPILEAYRQKLDTCPHPRTKADLLIGLIQYLRRRYRSTNEFKAEIHRYTDQLEAEAASIALKELVPISRAISFSRKFVSALGPQFGTDLKKRPRGNDLKKIRRLRAPKISQLLDPLYEFDLDSDSQEGVKNAIKKWIN